MENSDDCNRLLHKPGKDPHVSCVQTYIIPFNPRTNNFEKNESITEKGRLIPDHQFEFHNQHVTIHQVHRLINNIITCFKNKFLDFEKAFNKA